MRSLYHLLTVADPASAFGKGAGATTHVSYVLLLLGKYSKNSTLLRITSFSATRKIQHGVVLLYFKALMDSAGLRGRPFICQLEFKGPVAAQFSGTHVFTHAAMQVVGFTDVQGRAGFIADTIFAGLAGRLTPLPCSGEIFERTALTIDSHMVHPLAPASTATALPDSFTPTARPAPAPTIVPTAAPVMALVPARVAIALPTV